MSGGCGAGAKDGEARRLADRRLGREWADWDETAAPPPLDFTASPALFWRVSTTVGLIWLAYWFVLTAIVTYFARGLFPPPLIAAGLAVGAAPALSLFVLRRALRAGRPASALARAALATQRGLLLALTSPLLLLGGRTLAGASRDELVNSYLQIHNAFTRLTPRGHPRPGPVLVLAPRCIAPATMKALKAQAEAAGATFSVAGTGAKARAAVAEAQPRAIVAVACERDLLTGIRDTARRDLPILALCISLPLGPCKGAQLDLSRLTEALQWVNGRGEASD